MFESNKQLNPLYNDIRMLCISISGTEQLWRLNGELESAARVDIKGCILVGESDITRMRADFSDKTSRRFINVCV